MKLKLSHQAIGALMMALQNALQHETDIVPVLMDWDWAIFDKADGTRVGSEDNDLELELSVLNPPVVTIGDEEDADDATEVSTL